MNRPLGVLLEHVLAGEPPLGDEVDAVFRRADALRRRRKVLLLVAVGAIVGALVVAGYLLVTTLRPDRGKLSAVPTATAQAQPAATLPPPAASVSPSSSASGSASASASGSASASARASSASATPPGADSVLAAITSGVTGAHLKLVPREPSRGFGWRQYSLLTDGGSISGTLSVAVYAARGRFCFPAHDGDHSDCAQAKHTADGLDYVRYDNETIARRPSSGRTVAVMTTAQHSTDDPPLTGTQTRKIATNPALLRAFNPDEHCNDNTAADACPVFEVPVPTSN